MKLLLPLVALTAISCGSYSETRIEPDGDSYGGDSAGEYTFANVRSDCFSCHNSSAPAIPLNESSFKASAKVRARVLDGTMPPNSRGFDKSGFLSYLDD